MDIVHRNNIYMTNADYWSRLGEDICYDPLFKSYLDFDCGLCKTFPAPVDLPMFEYLRALSKFLEESAAEVILIAGKLHTEWKGSRQDGGCKMTTAKGVDSPAKAQHLFQWSDGDKLAKCNRVDR